MDLLRDGYEYIQSRSEEDILPRSINIHTKWDDINAYEVSGRYEDNSVLGTGKEMVDVSEDSELYEQIQTSFNEAINGLNTKNGAEVTNVSLRYTDEWDTPEYPFYSSAEADAQFFIGVSKTSVSQEIQEELTGMIVELLSEWDESVTSSSIVNAEWFFDDMDIVELLNVSGTVKSKYPQRYYDIDSVEEYVENVDGASMNQDLYEIHYKCSTDPNNSMMEPIPETMKERLEEVMWDYVEDTLGTNWEHRVEGEVIQFGEDPEYMSSDELMKYYVYVPVFEGGRGM